MNEDEEFFAWLDGELEGEAADRVAARVAASPELTARAQQHRRLASGLSAAFDPVTKQDVAAPTFERSNVVDFGAKASQRRRTWLSGPQWFAMAASLALGIVVGTQLVPGGSDVPDAVADDRVVAEGALDQALDTQLASAAAGPTRIGLTFRDQSGDICRSFRTAAESGLACRDGDDWRIRSTFRSAEGQAGDYRMAAGDDPRLAALIDRTISGEPFDAAEEKAALDGDWR